METYEQTPVESWSKLDKIRFLLDQWPAIYDGRASASDRSSSGTPLGVELLPAMANAPSVLELLALLGSLMSVNPSAYRHLKAYRCNAEWRQVRAMIRVRLTSGRWDEIPGWKRERIVPRWVSRQKVQDGDAFLEREFSGEVYIPKDLWDGLTKPIQQAV